MSGSYMCQGQFEFNIHESHDLKDVVSKFEVYPYVNKQS
jgi:hypothetical protein